jgi:hypothetical protein
VKITFDIVVAAFAGWQLSDPKFELYAEYVTANSRQEMQEITRGVVDALGEIVNVAAPVLFVSSVQQAFLSLLRPV